MGEMIKVFFDEMRKLDGLSYVDNYLRYQLSPLISRVKPAMTININQNRPIGEYWNKYGADVMQDLGLDYAVLRESKMAKILIIYDKELIGKLLQEEGIKCFLGQLGYTSLEVTKSIEYLTRRYGMYHCPHELGVFLGIPLYDVKAFMDCGNNSCLLCGYWKVYSNLDYAIDQFKKYDIAKENMLKKLIKELKSA